MTVCLPSEDAKTAVAPRALAFEVVDDSLALNVRRGDWVIVEPRSTFMCDCRYVLRSGEVVLLQAVPRRQLRVLSADGSEETLPREKVEEQLAGRVLRITRPVDMIDNCDMQMRSPAPNHLQ